MTFERNPGPPAEPGPTPVTGDHSGSSTSVQLRLQILSTEHWSLLASRSLAWNESFSRAGMYLSTLSGAMVALALVAGLDKTGDAFFLFAIVLLPAVLFVGVGTLLRLGAANYHDALCVMGMNRIRGAYLQIAPDLAPVFVMSPHDDVAGIAITAARPPEYGVAAHILGATPILVMVLNAVIGGAIFAIVALRIGAVVGVVLLSAAAAFLVVFATEMQVARRSMARTLTGIRPRFPTPGPASSRDDATVQ
jgi:hypothetical protein